MSIHLVNHTNTSSTHLNQSTNDVGYFHAWILAAKQQWQRHKTLSELRALDDRVLADIGINRSDIPRVVAGFNPRELEIVPTAKAAQTGDAKKDAYLKAA